VSYTALAGTAVLVAIAVDILLLRTRLLVSKVFWCTYAILLFFQLIVNGVLTGERVVRYSPHTIIGWRLAFAPVEDVAFGFALIMSTLSWWAWLARDHAATTPPSAGQAGEHHTADSVRTRGS
jgi:lycopene cyclase domain-containing protein